MGCFVYWVSEENARWYWRLLDAQAIIRATGHQGYGTWQYAWSDMDKVEAILGATKKLLRVWIADPNARRRRKVG